MTAAALLSCGCQFSPQATRWSHDFLLGKKQPEIPDRMMVIWSDTVLHQPQQPGVRGFGGRIYFFRGDGHAPIEVDGGLAVYAFDATATDPGSTKPERKFVFTADQFNEYMSSTDMGPSYSVWIPWDQVGGPARQLSLVTRFEGREGGVVISDPAIKLLPGIEQPSPGNHSPRTVHAGGNRTEAGATAAAVTRAGGPAGDAAPQTEPAIAQATHLNSRAPRPDRLDPRAAASGPGLTEVLDGRRREVTTIDIPPSFGRHLQHSAAQTSGDAEPRIDPQPTGNAEPHHPPDGHHEQDSQASREDRYRPTGQRYRFRRYPRRAGSTAAPAEAASSREIRTTPLKAGWIEPPVGIRNNR